MQTLPFPKLSNGSPGQALLIILLIMSVALTIGLSVVSRSITDIQISQQTEEAARAFSAAQAGIEEALIGAAGDGPFTGNFGTTASYTATVVGLARGDEEFAFPQPVSRNEAQTLWLAESQTLGKSYDRNQLRVLWGNAGTSANADQTPALEAILYYLDGTIYKAARFVLDPYGARLPANSFCSPTSCSGAGVSDFAFDGSDSAGGKNFQFGATLDLSGFSGTLLLARFRLLYTTDYHILGAKAGTGGTHSFPSQGERIDSTGQASGATRKVEVVRFYAAPPDIFDFVLSTGGNLAK